MTKDDYTNMPSFYFYDRAYSLAIAQKILK